MSAGRYAVFLEPKPAISGLPAVVALVCLDTVLEGPLDPNTFPEGFNGKFMETLIPRSELAGVFPGKDLEAMGIVGLALLTQTEGEESDPFKFGRRDSITRNSALVFKSDEGVYKHFDCENCASNAVKFIAQSQAEWLRPLN